MYPGRWDLSRTLSHYLQEGFAVLATTLVPLSEVAVIRGFAGLWSEVLADVARDRNLGPTALVDDLGHASRMIGMVGEEQPAVDDS